MLGAYTPDRYHSKSNRLSNLTFILTHTHQIAATQRIDLENLVGGHHGCSGYIQVHCTERMRSACVCVCECCVWLTSQTSSSLPSRSSPAAAWSVAECFRNEIKLQRTYVAVHSCECIHVYMPAQHRSGADAAMAYTRVRSNGPDRVQVASVASNVMCSLESS